MNIHFKGTLTKDEYADFFTLVNSQTKENPYQGPYPGSFLGPRVNRLPLILLLLGSVVMAALFFTSGIRRQDSVSLVMALAPALLVFLIILRVLRLRGGGRLSPATQAEWIEWIWKNEAPHTRVLEGDITDEGILMKRPTREILTRWNSIIGYGEYRNMLVLAPYNDDFLLFPKRLFERESDWDEFRNRVTKRMGVMYRVVESESGQWSQA